MAALAVLSVVLSLIASSAPVAADGPLPPPVAVTSQERGGNVVLTWLPPSTSSAEIRQTGCSSMNMSMTYVYENFTALYPNIHVTLRGGGNDLGFAQWIAGSSDIDQASRPINAAERQQAEARGINVTETRVGVESVAVVADPQVGVEELSLEQLRGLFNGSYDNWSQVGGADLPVRVFVPQQAGSPFLYFNSTVMHGFPFPSNATTVGDGRELADTVANTSGAVGFVRAGFLNGSQAHPILLKTDASDEAVSPLDLGAAYNGSYPLARYYSLYSNGPLMGGQGAWAAFVLDNGHGQRILADNGFLPLSEGDRINSTGHVATTSDEPVLGYKVLRTGPDGSTVTIETNSTELVDTNATAGGRYEYAVSAVYGPGQGESSQPVTVTVPASATTSGNPPLPSATLDLNAVVLTIAGLAVVATAVVLMAVGLRRR